jgi:hypothetical protein
MATLVEPTTLVEGDFHHPELAKRALSREQYNQIMLSKCMIDIRRLGFVIDEATKEVNKIEEHFEEDECVCVACTHTRKKDPYLSQDIIEACIAARLAMRSLSNLIETEFPGISREMAFKMTVERV